MLLQPCLVLAIVLDIIPFKITCSVKCSMSPERLRWVAQSSHACLTVEESLSMWNFLHICDNLMRLVFFAFLPQWLQQIVSDKCDTHFFAALLTASPRLQQRTDSSVWIASSTSFLKCWCWQDRRFLQHLNLQKTLIRDVHGWAGHTATGNNFYCKVLVRVVVFVQGPFILLHRLRGERGAGKKVFASQWTSYS